MPLTLTETSLSELSADAWRLIDAASVVVADLDGCLAADNIPLPGAVDFVNRLGNRLVVASNNSTHTAHQLSIILGQHGLLVRSERFVLAGELAVRIVAQQWPGARVMLLGTQAICEAAEIAGLRLVAEGGDVVLLTRAVNSGFWQLESAVAALHAGAELVVANPDLSHPGIGGEPRIETGALLALLKSVLPRLKALVIGKPEATIFRAALALDHAQPERSVMIGDNPATDIEGARRIRMNTIQLAAPAQRRAESALSALSTLAAQAN